MLKVKEIKELLASRSKEQIATMIIELYKLIPKGIKEEKRIDDLLTDPDKYLERRRRRKRTFEVPDIRRLSDETERFVDYAYKQYYFAPNQYVPKKERSKWRFIARRLFKELVQASGSRDAETVALACDSARLPSQAKDALSADQLKYSTRRAAVQLSWKGMFFRIANDRSNRRRLLSCVRLIPDCFVH